MVNVSRMIVGYGKLAEIKTLAFCYPFSEVKVRYDVGNGIKIHHARVGYDNEGRLCMLTKNPIHKQAQELISNELVSISRYLTKWRDLN